MPLILINTDRCVKSTLRSLLFAFKTFIRDRLVKGFVMKEKELGRLASSWKQTKSMAKTFAVFSSVYTTAQCYFKKLNSGRDSPVTAAAAGCVTGVVVSYSGGAMASLQGCAGMALFSYLFEGKSASSAVLAVDRARAAMLSTSDLFFSTTVLLSLANHTSMRHLPQIKTANIDRMKRIKDQEEERELRRILETSAGQKCYEYYCQHVLNKKPHGRDWRKRNRSRRRVRQRSTGLSLESLERYYYLIDRHARRRAADKSRPAIVS